MMAVTIKQTELPPDNYPAPPSGLSAAAAALSPQMIWQRIEAYCAVRWTDRPVSFVAQGPGEWLPTLSPAVITSTEVWSNADEWQDCDLIESPCGGFLLPTATMYRMTGVVGSDDDPPPAVVLEAYRRLAEFMAAAPSRPGVSKITTGSVSLAFDRDATGQAMQRSGAGDLLRTFRRAA